jgi:hypothetical protein
MDLSEAFKDNFSLLSDNLPNNSYRIPLKSKCVPYNISKHDIKHDIKHNIKNGDDLCILCNIPKNKHYIVNHIFKPRVDNTEQNNNIKNRDDLCILCNIPKNKHYIVNHIFKPNVCNANSN